LQSLSQLQSLDLSGTRITDQSLHQLARLPVLAELNLRDTAVTAPAVARLQVEYPQLKISFGVSRKGYSLASIGLFAVYALAVMAICFYGTHRYWLAWLFVR